MMLYVCFAHAHTQMLGPVSGEMLRMATRPALLCIEKPYLEGFVDSFVAW